MPELTASFLREVEQIWEKLLPEFFLQANLRPKQVLVLGCSTSEVAGARIGKGSSLEVAEVLFKPLWRWAKQQELFLAVQGCEHINRALVVEEDCVDYYRLEPVTVLPALHAGGAMAVKAWESMERPVMVEQIQAHAGIDVGDTFIGMHLKPVVVPIRLSVNTLGYAHLTAARTRPRLIGGKRAVYP